MSKLALLTEAQMRRIQPFFPISRGLRRVDDRRVVSGIVYVIRNGLQWKDAPRLRPAQDALQQVRAVEPARRVRPHLQRFGGAGRSAGKADDRQHPPQGAPDGASLAKKGMLHAASDAPAAG